MSVGEELGLSLSISYAFIFPENPVTRNQKDAESGHFFRPARKSLTGQGLPV
jgi:hypothetical protein